MRVDLILVNREVRMKHLAEEKLTSCRLSSIAEQLYPIEGSYVRSILFSGCTMQQRTGPFPHRNAPRRGVWDSMIRSNWFVRRACRMLLRIALVGLLAAVRCTPAIGAKEGMPERFRVPVIHGATRDTFT